MSSIKINIKGMACGHCIANVKKELSKLNLISAEVEVGSVQIEFDENSVSVFSIEKAIEASGYKIAN